MSLWAEIQSQEEVLGRLAQSQAEPTKALSQWMSGEDFSYVVMAARGSSDNAARYAQYLWGARNRLNVSLAAPSLFGPYASPPDLRHSLVAGISQSGESPDLLAVLAEGKRQGRPTLAITNHSKSPMARLADRHLDLGAGPELAIAATKSYTTQLLAIGSLSAGLSGDTSMTDALGLVGPAVGQVLAGAEAIKPAALTLSEKDRCVVIGRGFHQSTAYEWALKIAELSYLVAQPFSAADFRHGPLAMVEPGLPVLAIATDGPLFADLSDLLTQIREVGAKVVAISDRQDCPADHLIALPPGFPEWLTPIPAIVAAQIFTYHLTVARGADPDRPRMLKKVTRTV
ncbi:MAG TPA: SIS domain-containing protein [Acidimicrobiia bacterium]|nr:SIS domain-containing protein [Acidimicrobiia bacterium]